MHPLPAGFRLWALLAVLATDLACTCCSQSDPMNGPPPATAGLGGASSSSPASPVATSPETEAPQVPYSDSDPAITLSAPGGYVTPETGFVVGLPYLRIEQDGRIIRLARGPAGQHLWKTGVLSDPTLAELLLSLRALGFWEWDSAAMEKEIFAQDLITDLPTTVLVVRDNGETKTFACYGLRDYFEYRDVKSLENPVRALDLLEGLGTPDLYYPTQGEVLLAPADPETAATEASGAWPLPELPPQVHSGEYEGLWLGSYQGVELHQIVDVLSQNAVIEFAGAHYEGAYRPVFSQQ